MRFRALTGGGKALQVLGESASVHSLGRNLFAEALETNATTWSSLGAIYHDQGRLIEATAAWERASALLPYPAPELLAFGYTELAARHPQKALQQFDRAAVSWPPTHER